MGETAPAGRQGGLGRGPVAASLAAALLPLLVFAALQAAFSAKSARQAAEIEALDHARAIMTAVDARLERTRGAAAALATNGAVERGDWAAAYERAKEIADLNPDWNRVILRDRERSIEYFDTSRPFGAPRPSRSFGFDPRRLTGPSELVVGGIELAGDGCPCVHVHVPTGGDAGRVLTISLDGRIFQELLMEQARPGTIASVVDRAGRAIARSRAYEQRVGRPESEELRVAVLSGGAGIYRSVTLDGFENYTAYAASPLSGWSAHYAFAPSVLDLPQTRWAGATALAMLAGAAVAIAATWLLFRYVAAERKLAEQRAEAERAEALAQLKVARDLHDGVLQFLTGLVLRMEALRRSSDDARAVEELGVLQAELRAEQVELRRFIDRINPRNGATGLPPAGSLRELAESLSRRWNVSVEVRQPEADGLVAPSMRRHIEYLVREAAANAVRHGHARRIAISLTAGGDRLLLSIEDDGRGFPVPGRFDPEALAASPQRPRSIICRLGEIGGTLAVETGAAGSRLLIHLPCRETACVS